MPPFTPMDLPSGVGWAEGASVPPPPPTFPWKEATRNIHENEQAKSRAN